MLCLVIRVFRPAVQVLIQMLLQALFQVHYFPLRCPLGLTGLSGLPGLTGLPEGRITRGLPEGLTTAAPRLPVPPGGPKASTGLLGLGLRKENYFYHFYPEITCWVCAAGAPARGFRQKKQ